MYCIVPVDDTEVNTAKIVNISTEFNKYENVNQTQNEKNSK